MGSGKIPMSGIGEPYKKVRTRGGTLFLCPYVD